VRSRKVLRVSPRRHTTLTILGSADSNQLRQGLSRFEPEKPCRCRFLSSHKNWLREIVLPDPRRAYEALPLLELPAKSKHRGIRVRHVCFRDMADKAKLHPVSSRNHCDVLVRSVNHNRRTAIYQVVYHAMRALPRYETFASACALQMSDSDGACIRDDEPFCAPCFLALGFTIYPA
jgi:hypothetical protein